MINDKIIRNYFSPIIFKKYEYLILKDLYDQMQILYVHSSSGFLFQWQ